MSEIGSTVQKLLTSKHYSPFDGFDVLCFACFDRSSQTLPPIVFKFSQFRRLVCRGPPVKFDPNRFNRSKVINDDAFFASIADQLRRSPIFRKIADLWVIGFCLEGRARSKSLTKYYEINTECSDCSVLVGG